MKAEDEDEWTTREADNGAWSAAGPSPGFRIGFGDYFDCDCLPECGTAVMAWSETVNGAQPWQSWVRTLDMCEDKESLVDVLEDELDYLTASFETQELPFPRTQQTVAKFQDNLKALRKRLDAARSSLKASRDVNPRPTEEKVAETQAA